MPDIMAMSVQELRALRRTLPEDTTQEQRAALDELIEDKISEESRNSMLGVLKGAQAAEAAEAKVLKMWPELKDKESEFSKKVNETLEASGQSDDPVARMHAANMLGLEMGMVPAGFSPAQMSDPMRGIKGGNDDGDEDPAEDKTPFLDRTKDIAASYANVLDTSDKEVMKQIEERAAQIREERTNGAS